jgi:hypothetical protein
MVTIPEISILRNPHGMEGFNLKSICRFYHDIHKAVAKLFGFLPLVLIVGVQCLYFGRESALRSVDQLHECYTGLHRGRPARQRRCRKPSQPTYPPDDARRPAVHASTASRRMPLSSGHGIGLENSCGSVRRPGESFGCWRASAAAFARSQARDLIGRLPTTRTRVRHLIRVGRVGGINRYPFLF